VTPGNRRSSEVQRANDPEILRARAAWITVGLSDHRVEALGPAEQAMEGHRTVVLEEPPADSLQAVLNGDSSITEHLEAMVAEFPEYSRRQYEIIRRLHRNGVLILQMDPFMADLERIHDLFDAGHSPDDIDRDAVLRPVYSAERRWTGALLGYYAASSADEFERVVGAVCDFARADAARGRLRDRMRARQIASLVENVRGGIYVEAGSVHAGLVGALRRRLPDGVRVLPRWLLGDVVRELGETSPIGAPGDLLTLAHTVGRSLPLDLEKLLAARSLIHVAISSKEELLPSPDEPFPHTSEEVQVRRLVDQLDCDDCRRLFPVVRSRPHVAARTEVESYLARRARAR
jgi:hypothetical protein